MALYIIGRCAEILRTGFAFALWNANLRVLSVMESSIINNLSEGVTPQERIGIVLASLGILNIQLRRKQSAAQIDRCLRRLAITRSAPPGTFCL
jgi:hypothetical protein